MRLWVHICLYCQAPHLANMDKTQSCAHRAPERRELLEAHTGRVPREWAAALKYICILLRMCFRQYAARQGGVVFWPKFPHSRDDRHRDSCVSGMWVWNMTVYLPIYALVKIQRLMLYVFLNCSSHDLGHCLSMNLKLEFKFSWAAKSFPEPACPLGLQLYIAVPTFYMDVGGPN